MNNSSCLSWRRFRFTCQDSQVLLALKEQMQIFHVILIPRLGEKPEVGVARIFGVDAVLVRPLSKAKLLSVVDSLG